MNKLEAGFVKLTLEIISVQKLELELLVFLYKVLKCSETELSDYD